jgi:predicted acyl esterase
MIENEPRACALTRRQFAQALLEAAGLLALPGAAHAASPAPETPEAASGFDVALLRNVMVPMRDRVHLATDVYLPARNGEPVAAAFPVILERTQPQHWRAGGTGTRAAHCAQQRPYRPRSPLTRDPADHPQPR